MAGEEELENGRRGGERAEPLMPAVVTEGAEEEEAVSGWSREAKGSS